MYPDAPTPADYLKREHASVALVRLASQYPSRFLVIFTEAKEGELTDRPFPHLHRALMLPYAPPFRLVTLFTCTVVMATT